MPPTPEGPAVAAAVTYCVPAVTDTSWLGALSASETGTLSTFRYSRSSVQSGWPVLGLVDALWASNSNGT